MIPYGLDVENSPPATSQPARDVLGIRKTGRCRLFVADLVDDRRRGSGSRPGASGRERPGDLICSCSLGYDDRPGSCSALSFHLERIDNDRILSLAYGAADVS